MRALGVVVLGLLGCQVAGPAGPAGERGPQGEPGDRGPQGERGPAGVDAARGLRWVDAAGTLVGDGLIYVDTSGNLWLVDLETARLGSATRQTLFTGTLCTGAAYVAPLPPREVFKLDDAAFRVRQDDAQLADIQFQSIGTPTACMLSAGNTRAVSLGDTTEVQMPTVSFVGPVHRELR